MEEIMEKLAETIIRLQWDIKKLDAANTSERSQHSEATGQWIFDFADYVATLDFLEINVAHLIEESGKLSGHSSACELVETLNKQRDLLLNYLPLLTCELVSLEETGKTQQAGKLRRKKAVTQDVLQLNQELSKQGERLLSEINVILQLDLSLESKQNQGFFKRIFKK